MNHDQAWGSALCIFAVLLFSGLTLWAACAAGGHQDDHTENDSDATEAPAPVNGLTYDVDPWPGHTP